MNKDKLIAEVNGEKKEFDIYFTLVCNETQKGYIAYTDHSLDENGKEQVHVSVYDPNVGFDTLGEIQSQAEWDLINNVIDRIKNIS